jgi:hypothetical protein
LWNLRRNPSLLNGMQRAIGGFQAFNRGDRFARDVTNGDTARAGGFAIDMDGAGAASRYAATEFRASQAQFLTDNPQ